MTKPNPNLAKRLALANKPAKKAGLFEDDKSSATGFKTIDKPRARKARKPEPAPNITAKSQPKAPPILEHFKVGDIVRWNDNIWKVANIQPTKENTLSVTLFRKPATQKTVRFNPHSKRWAKIDKVD